jgi:hypothetical protein
VSLDIFTKETPKQIILEDFKINLPISGGWGYSFDTACVIDKNNSEDNNLFEVEQIFVEKRIYEEMIIFRDINEKYFGIRWELESQKLIKQNDKKYDYLVFSVIAFTEAIWQELTNRFEAIEHKENSALLNDLDVYRESKSLKFKREYYFDISSFD